MSTPTLPQTGLALQITERKQTTPLTLARVDIPALGPHELLLENVAIAQAPGDLKHVDLDMIPTFPYTNGWDCSGVVVGLGSEVKDFAIRDRVASSAPAKTARHGAYQQYTITSNLGTCKIPAGLAHEDASTCPLAFATSIAGLHALSTPPGGVGASLPLPSLPDSVAPILVWGAASSVGAMAVQLAKLSGYRVIATASAKNFDYGKKLGADWVVDYNEGEEAVEKIRELAGGRLSLVYDGISLPASISLGLKAIGPRGGKIALTLPARDLGEHRSDVELIYAGAHATATNPELRSAFRLLETLLAKNLIVFHPCEIIPGGLTGVNEGWRRQRAGEVNAVKLVYRVKETPGI